MESPLRKALWIINPFEPIKQILLCVLMILFGINSYGQVQVSIEDQTGLPIEGALVRQSDFQGFTNAEGVVEITPFDQGAPILVSSLGFKDRVFYSNDSEKALRYSLQPDDIVLSELIVRSDAFSNKKRDNGNAISILGRRNLTQGDNLTLAPVLNTVPGVFMHSGALNTNRLTIRGVGSRSLFSTNKIKAYLDGIPLSSGDGETTLEDIDFSTLSNVEIVRGPSSSLFGAGLGGAINLTTREPDSLARLSSDLTIGSYGLVKSNNRINIGDGQKGLGLFYQNIRSDGYRDNNEYDRSSLSLLGKVVTKSNWRLGTYVNYTRLKAFIPSSLDSTTFIENPSAAAQNWAAARGFEDNDRLRVGLTAKKAFSSRVSSAISVFMNYRESFEVRPFNILEEEVNNVGLRATVFWNIIKDGRLEAILGTEYFNENYDELTFENLSSSKGENLSNFSQSRTYSNIFSALEYRPSKSWVFTLGANLNNSSFRTTDNLVRAGVDLSAGRNFSAILSPRLSAVYHLDERISLYTQWSQGYSLPSFDETLNPDGLINPDIEPETGTNYEVGLKGAILDGKVYFEANVYTLRVKNLLVARRVSEDDFIGINAGKTTHNGFEMTLNHYLSKGTNLTIDHSLNVNVTDYSFDEFIDGEDNFSGNQLTGVPNYNGVYQVNFSFKNIIYGNINWQFTGAMPIRDDNSIFSRSYDVVNIKLGHRRSLGRFSIHAYAGINNILDEKYASMLLINAGSFGGRAPRYYYPGLPVNWFAGTHLSVSF